MVSIPVNSLKNGSAIFVKNEPWVVTSFQHVNPGKGSAFMKLKLRNLKNGKTLEQTIKSSEYVDEADVTRRYCQFLYFSGENSVFMDNDTFEQYEIATEVLDGKHKFLKEGVVCTVLMLDGIPFSAELPKKVELMIVETPPAEKGDSATGATKPAILETGATISVPLYLANNTLIRINTESETFVERVN
ncbi:MAG: elongation factor P [Patescibacteria group bacterium]